MSEDAGFHWSEGMKFVTEGIKAFFTLNGAAAISILTFIGNHKSSPDALAYAMVSFSLGALTGPVAFACAYFTQLGYGNGHLQLAWRFHRLTYFVVAFGTLLFLCGMVLAAISFVQM